MLQTKQTKENKNIRFSGTDFAGGVILVVLIILLLFGSTDLEKLSNAPSE